MLVTAAGKVRKRTRCQKKEGNHVNRMKRFLPQYDVVVVGAGVGGLSAALKFAHSHVKVLLLEKHNMTGGYSTSFVRGRYEFEASLHELCECGDKLDGHTYGGVREFLDSVGVYPEYVQVPDAFRVIMTKLGIDFTMPFGIENAIAALDKVEPGCAPKVREYFKLCEEIYEALIYIQSCNMNPSPGIMATKYSSFLRSTAYSVGQIFDYFQFPEKIRKILSSYGGYITRNLKEVSFTVWALMNYLYIHDGAHVINKTSHALAADMEERLRELGGQVETNVTVDRLLVENGTVCGVKTTDGDVIRARRVLCNFSPNNVYNFMMDKKDIPEMALKLTGARKLNSSILSVYIGLDALPSALGIDSYEYFITEDMDSDKIYEVSKKWQLTYTKTSFTCPDVAIPGLTGPDRCQVNFTCLYDPDAMCGHTDPKGYLADKERLASGLIDLFEKATGLRIRDHVEEIEIATPATYARYGGAPKGTVYGYEMTPVDGIVPRTLAIQEEQYIPGLDFVGGYGRRSLGFCCSIINGYNTACDTLKKFGR